MGIPTKTVKSYLGVRTDGRTDDGEFNSPPSSQSEGRGTNMTSGLLFGINGLKRFLRAIFAY